jgi:hypothetical protein
MATVPTTTGDNNLDFSLSVRDDLNKLLTLDTSGGATWAGKTFTAFIRHGSSTTAITVTNTLDASQRTLTLDKATHATIGAGKYDWYLLSSIAGADVQELSGVYEITA